MDDYIYTSDDEIIEGEVEIGKIYEEADFNRIIEIKEREAKRVKIFLSEINQNEKAMTDAIGNIVWSKRIEIPDGSQISIPYKWQVFFALNDVKAQDYIIEFFAKEKSINEQPSNEPVYYKVAKP